MHHRQNQLGATHLFSKGLSSCCRGVAESFRFVRTMLCSITLHTQTHHCPQGPPHILIVKAHDARVLPATVSLCAAARSARASGLCKTSKMTGKSHAPASAAETEVKSLLPSSDQGGRPQSNVECSTPGKPVVPKRTMGAIKLGFVAFVAVCGGSFCPTIGWN